MKDKDLIFKSKLSMEEIEDNFKDYDCYENIKASLEEVLAYEKGNPSRVRSRAREASRRWMSRPRGSRWL